MKQKSTTALDELIGNNIRIFRTAKGFTSQEIARAIGVTHQQFHKYEHGLNRVPASRLFQIADFLGVDVNDFRLKSANKNERMFRMELMFMKNFHNIKNESVKQQVHNLVSAISQNENFIENNNQTAQRVSDSESGSAVD